ncbi:MAG TPA: nucleotidyltransferase family protein [Bacteroidota bacterium]|nr:nucleotidyltransferase family protein [Bacteroidota bacterium]
MKNYAPHIIYSTASIKDGLIALNRLSNNVLCLFVVETNERLVGTVTDGDIRRALIFGRNLTDSIESAMEKKFVKITAEKIIPAEIKTYREKGIKLLPCVDNDGRILRVYDLVERVSILPVDAVLMAGGKGERLRPLTEHTPKSLLKVGGKAIIDYNIDLIMRFGIEHIHVTVNYLAEQIEAHFADATNGASICCVREPEYLGTIGSVKYISKFHHDTILVMNSDVFTNIDLEEFYNHFQMNDADLAVAAIPYSVPVQYGILELDDILIKGLREKPVFDYYANAGIYLIKRKLLDHIPANTFFDATDYIELLIARKYKVIRFPIIGYWIDIGKHEDYKKVQEFVKHIKG